MQAKYEDLHFSYSAPVRVSATAAARDTPAAAARAVTDRAGVAVRVMVVLALGLTPALADTMGVRAIVGARGNAPPSAPPFWGALPRAPTTVPRDDAPVVVVPAALAVPDVRAPAAPRCAVVRAAGIVVCVMATRDMSAARTLSPVVMAKGDVAARAAAQQMPKAKKNPMNLTNALFL